MNALICLGIFHQFYFNLIIISNIFAILLKWGEGKMHKVAGKQQIIRNEGSLSWDNKIMQIVCVDESVETRQFEGKNWK